MYNLTAWSNPPNDERATHQGQIFKHIQKEWTAQIGNIREAAEADKDDDGQVNKGDSKQAKPKPR